MPPKLDLRITGGFGRIHSTAQIVSTAISRRAANSSSNSGDIFPFFRRVNHDALPGDPLSVNRLFLSVNHDMTSGESCAKRLHRFDPCRSNRGQNRNQDRDRQHHQNGYLNALASTVRPIEFSLPKLFSIALALLLAVFASPWRPAVRRNSA
jgi:hypothetical protein